MVALMIVLGGATRLTESGLSIVNWQPVTGILPPLNDLEWAALFTAYMQTPEFTKINFWMTVGDFKSIYWLEYLHRLWGRLIGIVFFLPYIYFLCRRVLPSSLIWRFGGLFLLGGIQGLVGWYMVQSGLNNEPSVSQYRLAGHLSLAFVIFGLLFWYSLSCLTFRPVKSGSGWVSAGSVTILCCIGVTSVWGAFVAGLDAGRAYNTFPLMDGQLVPRDLLLNSPWWINFFENTVAVQFTHRFFAVGTVILIFLFWVLAYRTSLTKGVRRAIDILALTALCQLGIGIFTLLSGVPLTLGMLHQMGALVLITAAIWVRYQIGN
jgi:cytochrome c oxidase assembly protein subunit 15